MKIAIVIPTYQRPDGKTPFYLSRAINSVLAQTHGNWELYLIGDNYINEIELTVWANLYRVNTFNLTKAKERDKYKPGSYELWCAGGVNANNIGIELALNDGLSYICHLDHDDYWSKDHLKLINKKAEQCYPFICTRSTYLKEILPKANSGRYKPVACGLIHSSTCIDFSKTDLRYRDCFAETGEAYPADADLWRRYDKEGYLIDKLTCFHEEERQ
jgi:glycosyltransferase involved in cell wall biosynthesis